MVAPPSDELVAAHGAGWQSAGMANDPKSGLTQADRLAAALNARKYDEVDRLLDAIAPDAGSIRSVNAGNAADLRALVDQGTRSGPNLNGDSVFAYLRNRFGR